MRHTGLGRLWGGAQQAPRCLGNLQAGLQTGELPLTRPSSEPRLRGPRDTWPALSRMAAPCHTWPQSSWRGASWTCRVL